jgi:type I restriction enzyme S subunit
MNVPKGYKMTEVGVIPEDWEVKTLSEMCIKIQDGTHFSPSLGGSDYLYLTSKNIGYGNLILDNIDTIDQSQHKKIYSRCDVKKGDVLLTKDGVNTGNAALNILDEEFSLLSSVAFLRFNPAKYDANHFLQQILSPDGQKRIKDLMSGNAITRLTLEKIHRIHFPVPPLPEQQAIARVLSDTDALINALDKLIAKKRDIKKAVMQELLTGKTRLPGFSGEWEVKKLGDIGSFRGGNSFPTIYQGNIEGCYPFFKVSDMNNNGNEVFMVSANNYISELTQKKLCITVFPKGSIVFAKVGAAIFLERKKILNQPSCIDNNMMAFIPNTNLVDTRFIHTMLHLKRFGCYVSTTALPSLSGKQLSEITIVLPPISEQQAIAQILSDIDSEITALEQRRDKMKAIKQGMMQELLTGRIRLK